MPKQNFPAEWSLTIDDLVAQQLAGTRTTITEQQRLWAIEYERSLLPTSTRFPKSGDIYLCTKDCELQLQVYFAAPVSKYGSVIFPHQHSLTVVNMDEDDEPVWVFAHPTDKSLEEVFVPAEYLNSAYPRYDGFALIINTALLNSHFKLIGHDKSFDKNC